MNKLVIFWGDKTDEHFYWYLQSNSAPGQADRAVPHLESHEILKADLACMAEMAQGKRVELILSSSDIHLTQVTMPNKAQRHLRKAVPYLLEEEIAEPIDDVFIAIGERLKDEKIPVRALNLSYFSQIIQQFEIAEINLDSAYVDLDLVKSPDDGCQLALLNQKVLFVDKDNARWSCDVSDFNWLVQKYLAHQEEEELPVAIPMTVISDDNDSSTQFEEQLPVGRFAPLGQIVDSVVEELANFKRADVKSVPINLLQGDFEPKAERSPLKSMILKVINVAAVILLAHITYQGSQWFSLNQQKARLGAEKVALWKQAFPGRKVPTNQDKALRSFISTLSSGEGDNSFLSMLHSTSDKIENLQQIYPTNISYDSARNELRVDLVAKDLPILNKYRDDLKQSGHQVEMSSATQRGDGYSSRLIIRK